MSYSAFLVLAVVISLIGIDLQLQSYAHTNAHVHTGKHRNALQQQAWTLLTLQHNISKQIMHRH
jgi:hypothetical protein